MNQYEKAKAWRERIGLSKEELGEAIGYTAISIYWFDRGETPPNRRAKSGRANERHISDWVFQRYKRACGDLDAELFGRKKGTRFDW